MTRVGVAALIALRLLAAADARSPIRVDQAGYLPGFDKIAVVVSSAPAQAFEVRALKGDRVVLRAKLTPAVDDADSGDRVRIADFSAVRVTGEYYVDVAGVGKSGAFRIGPDVYARVLYLATRAFYGQRCGTAVDLGPEFAGYRHAACHLDAAFDASSGRSGPYNNKGGWHDAGDYGRYIVNSGISTGTLLWAWEMFSPRLKGLRLNLPESGNGTPDILNEVRWNLDWMLSLQDADGGVWHKQTSARFCPFVMPENDHLPSLIIGTGQEPFKSTGATADLAAVAAIAARVWKPFDAAYANKCLRAARAAWAWTEKNPAVLFHNPRGITTGEYGDRDCSDEMLWAAAELWRTTGDVPFGGYFAAHYRLPLSTPSWSNVAPLALWTYVLAPAHDAAAVAAIREASVAAAAEIAKRTNANPYRVSLTPADYVWGSNAVAANYAMQLLVTNAIAPDRSYVAAALDNLHYILGRNALALCFVTRVGWNSVRHPHHRPSGADNNPEPWPGLMAGGPNHRRQDPAMRNMPDLPPAKMYLDQQDSYATNEVAINWNAPLVFLVSAAASQ